MNANCLRAESIAIDGNDYWSASVAIIAFSIRLEGPDSSESALYLNFGHRKMTKNKITGQKRVGPRAMSVRPSLWNPTLHGPLKDFVFCSVFPNRCILYVRQHYS